MRFGSHTDASVTVAAGLVNVGTPGERRGRPFAVPVGAALRTAVGDVLRSGSPRARPPALQALPAYIELAGAARPVFRHVEDGALDRAAATVNGLLGRFRPTPFLDSHDGEPWHLHFHGAGDGDPTGWGGGIAVGLATVLGSVDAHRLGVCGAAACDRVFVDVSRNGTRRFCSTACQNRVKAATHRARARP